MLIIIVWLVEYVLIVGEVCGGWDGGGWGGSRWGVEG